MLTFLSQKLMIPYYGPDRRNTLKISFYQQTVSDAEKTYGESRSVHGQKTSEARSATGCYVPGWGWDEAPGAAMEKGKSLIELQQEAAHMDVGITQDYMTVMSNTMSHEDYAKCRRRASTSAAWSRRKP